MKKLLTTLIVLLGLTNTVHAQYRIFDSGQVGSNPQANYYLKTDGVNSTWAAVSAGGGGADGNWVFFNGSGIRLATTTNQLAIGNTATTSDSVVEITKTSAGNIIDLLMLKILALQQELKQVYFLDHQMWPIKLGVLDIQLIMMVQIT